MNTHRKLQPPLDRTWGLGRVLLLLLVGVLLATLFAAAAANAGSQRLPMDDGVPANVTTLPVMPR